jgi:hypothetical protein
VSNGSTNIRPPANPRQSRIAAVGPIFEELVERQKDGGRFDADFVGVNAKHGATMGDEVFRAISCEARTERNWRKLATWTGEVSRKSRQGDHAWQGVRRP